MFTGLIEELGEAVSLRRSGQSLCLGIRAKEVIEDIKAGDSISVDGVCLTVTLVKPPTFYADVVAETLRCTTLGALRVGNKVNLERALKVGDRIGGHFLTGHIDGIGVITQKIGQGETVSLKITVPGDLEKYIIPKGSIGVDGISLTVVESTTGAFTVALIPHTLKVTTLGLKKVGDKVNLEVDILDKYVEKMGGITHEGKEITYDFLITHGFG